jgi:hypothetical protein
LQLVKSSVGKYAPGERIAGTFLDRPVGSLGDKSAEGV